MTRRYYLPKLPKAGGAVQLDVTEAHHAINVMRVRPNDEIELFDGRGLQATGRVEHVAPRQVSCLVDEAKIVDCENGLQLVLGIAMPKGDRAKELVERLTELGVNRLVPLRCQRSQWGVSDSSFGKWQRTVIEACKQSGRNVLMEIAPEIAATDWFEQNNAAKGFARYIAHPGIRSAGDVGIDDEIHAGVMVAIGPEGGFSDDEVTLASNFGWQRLTLGRRIYRIETAAIVAAVRLAKL